MHKNSFYYICSEIHNNRRKSYENIKLGYEKLYNFELKTEVFDWVAKIIWECQLNWKNLYVHKKEEDTFSDKNANIISTNFISGLVYSLYNPESFFR